jgi:hypothetical protein
MRAARGELRRANRRGERRRGLERTCLRTSPPGVKALGRAIARFAPASSHSTQRGAPTAQGLQTDRRTVSLVGGAVPEGHLLPAGHHAGGEPGRRARRTGATAERVRPARFGGRHPRGDMVPARTQTADRTHSTHATAAASACTVDLLWSAYTPTVY